jgi:RNA polymerase sigma factor (sigma-70 family)
MDLFEGQYAAVEAVNPTRNVKELQQNIALKRDLVMAYLCHRFPDQQIAWLDDCAQDTMLVAIRKADTFRGTNTNDLDKWLNKIAINCGLQALRKVKGRRKNGEHEVPSSDYNSVLAGNTGASEQTRDILEVIAIAKTASYDELKMQDEVRTAVAKQIDSLRPRDGVLLRLRYFEDMSYRDIADLYKANENTIKARIRRAQLSLRKDMINSGCDIEDMHDVLNA